MGIIVYDEGIHEKKKKETSGRTADWVWGGLE